MHALLKELIDLAIRLLERRESRNRQFYAEFVRPMVDSFERIHAQYLASFRRYKQLLDDARISLDERHPVFEAIQEDSILTMHERAYFTDDMRTPSDKRLTKLVYAIRAYLYSAASLPHSADSMNARRIHMQMLNPPRAGLYARLLAASRITDLSSADKISYMKDLIDEALLKLQSSHGQAMHEFELMQLECCK